MFVIEVGGNLVSLQNHKKCIMNVQLGGGLVGARFHKDKLTLAIPEIAISCVKRGRTNLQFSHVIRHVFVGGGGEKILNITCFL